MDNKKKPRMDTDEHGFWMLLERDAQARVSAARTVGGLDSLSGWNADQQGSSNQEIRPLLDRFSRPPTPERPTQAFRYKFL
jgi:hypothetical protein